MFQNAQGKTLRARIAKREEKSQSQIDSKTEIGWGHQIRSYVLQPYRLVKDLRYKIEDTNPDGVLNGILTNLLKQEFWTKINMKKFLISLTLLILLTISI